MSLVHNVDCNKNRTHMSASNPHGKEKTDANTDFGITARQNLLHALFLMILQVNHTTIQILKVYQNRTSGSPSNPHRTKRIDKIIFIFVEKVAKCILYQNSCKPLPRIHNPQNTEVGHTKVCQIRTGLKERWLCVHRRDGMQHTLFWSIFSQKPAISLRSKVGVKWISGSAPNPHRIIRFLKNTDYGRIAGISIFFFLAYIQKPATSPFCKGYPSWTAGWASSPRRINRTGKICLLWLHDLPCESLFPPTVQGTSNAHITASLLASGIRESVKSAPHQIGAEVINFVGVVHITIILVDISSRIYIVLPIKSLPKSDIPKCVKSVSHPIKGIKLPQVPHHFRLD